ncbi:DUF368 domain-containing protein [Marinobacter changyiensis]|uniref:DUF368 domain-containing protein n=1 Tax=Marinobacter changyiensis TaxID=2604091 RepID=UPI001FEC82B9|nr:DUF368 domain-containing protein [Marinobacter changyiensis]
MNEPDYNTPREAQHPLGIFLRGMAMGAADIVPGVSGGTIAFITGIYFRLLAAIDAVPSAFVRQLCRGQVSKFWQATDGRFLATLLAGILISVFTLASVISHALTQYPILLWSFFFGLIVASVWHVGRVIKAPRPVLMLPLLTGVIFAWWVTTLSPGQVDPSALAIFGSGALAICAMILPGISGSFILVILGMYAPILAAIKGVELGTLVIFAAGCVVGLLSIARLLTWAVQRFHDTMLALLIGFMIGALNKVWPWKQTLSWRTNSAGEQVPMAEISVSPVQYADLTGAAPELLGAFLAVLAGFFLVLLVEWMASAFKGRTVRS